MTCFFDLFMQVVTKYKYFWCSWSWLERGWIRSVRSPVVLDAHRWIGPRTVTIPTRLTYLSVYDRRDSASEHAPSPSPRTLPAPQLLNHTCTHVHRLSQPKLAFSSYVRKIDTSKCVCHGQQR
jgi:hypothetical protein